MLLIFALIGFNLLLRLLVLVWAGITFLFRVVASLINLIKP